MPVVTVLAPAAAILVSDGLGIGNDRISINFLGGGFFVKYHGLWTMRGLVSSGTMHEQGGCDVDRYTLFTSALDYTSWIDDVVKINASLPTSSSLPTSYSLPTSSSERERLSKEVFLISF